MLSENYIIKDIYTKENYLSLIKMIIDREILRFSESQERMIKSGWGADAVDNAVVEKITYESDGLKVKGYLAYPKSEGLFPSVVWCRGGFGNAGAIDRFTAQGVLGQIAGWGYCVFASQYRGNDGGEGSDEFGGGDLNDVLNLIPLANEVEKADPENWAIEGWSRGGMMTYLILTKSNLFKAAIVTGGIADLRCNSEQSSFMRKLYKSSFGSGGSGRFEELCYSRSIINFPEKLADTPLLLIHGADDERVLPNDSLELAEKLLELKKRFRLVIIEEGDHFLKKHKKEVDGLRKNWFDKYLKNKS